MQKKNGIVLKSYFPQKMKIVLLDQQLGKIEGIPSYNLSGGSLISYYAQPKGSCYFLQDIDLLDMPLALAADDILFLHHVLEITYFCAPYSSSALDIFELIMQLYKEDISPFTFGFKVAFLFKLLMLLGMHPDEPRFQNSYYYELAQESIDTIILKSIDLNTKQALPEWVRCCLKTHPLIHVFKTVHFLDIDRLL